jgi:hypothetical protein
VQSPDASNETGRPELAVGEIPKSGFPNVCGSGPLNEIVCFAFAIANVRGSEAGR